MDFFNSLFRGLKAPKKSILKKQKTEDKVKFYISNINIYNKQIISTLKIKIFHKNRPKECIKIKNIEINNIILDTAAENQNCNSFKIEDAILTLSELQKLIITIDSIKPEDDEYVLDYVGVEFVNSEDTHYIYLHKNDIVTDQQSNDGWTNVNFNVEFKCKPKNLLSSTISLDTLGFHPWKGNIDKIGLEVILDDTRLKFINFKKNIYNFELEEKAKATNSYSHELYLKCRSFRPCDLGLNEDTRELGLDLKSIDIFNKKYKHHQNIYTFKNANLYKHDHSMEDHIDEFRNKGAIIGNHTSIHAGTVLDPSHMWLIEIGDYVTIATGCYIIAHDASTKNGFLNHTRIGKVVIKDFTFIGVGSIILPGITIGSNTIIGAGSVVTKSIPDNVVAAGNPAKIICSIEKFKKRRRDEFENSTKFDESYSYSNKINQQKIDEVKNSIKDGFGYVI